MMSQEIISLSQIPLMNAVKNAVKQLRFKLKRNGKWSLVTQVKIVGRIRNAIRQIGKYIMSDGVPYPTYTFTCSHAPAWERDECIISYTLDLNPVAISKQVAL